MAGITGTKALLEGLGKRGNRGGIAHNGYPSYLEAFVCNGKATIWDGNGYIWWYANHLVRTGKESTY